ncbi:hypothetical protein [Streptomyces sp. HNA39]|uniref:hypothetical protein n=1 Tax=Streptomyces sp. HNA39 TaxID=2850561 RepID=UPI002010469C|nr:hypothetical protein [Streptomyces sp. HNA39]UQA34776.1 hypothetical protein KRR37_14270 [Streptomyces sp. HNA39]
MTALALCHLVLITGVTSYVRLTTDLKDDGWVLWFFVPLNVFMHLAVASVFGGQQLGRVPLTLVASLFAIGLTTLTALMADLPLTLPGRPERCG